MAARQQQTTNALKSFRVPLVGTMQNRDGTQSKDQRFINCFPESKKNDITEAKRIYLYQRPGLVPMSTVAANQIGRGVHYWNGKTYSVFGDKIYSNTTAIQTITTTTGMCAIEVGTTDTTEVLVVADGVYVYVITKADVVTAVPLTLSAWASSTAYSVGSRVIPTTPNGFYYEVVGTTGTAPYTSGATEPVWPDYLGETIVDNELTWVAKGTASGAGTWTAVHAYSIGQRIKVSAGATNYLFEVMTAGTSGATAPAWSFVAGNTTLDGTAEWICTGEDRADAPPKYHMPSIVYLDGYLFLVLKKTDGSGSADIFNSDLDNPYSWNPTNYITAEQFPDNLSALSRQNNMIVAFGEYSTEFFYDNGNATGSPLARNNSYTLQAGICSPNAIYSNEKFCLFVGQSNSGGRAVWLLDGFMPKKISDEFVERIIDAEGTALVNATGYGLRTNGHLFYIINLTSTTLVYDLEERMWHEWQGVNCVAMTDGDQTAKAIMQHATNGKLYYLDPTVGTDDSTAITMQVYTTKYDMETMNLKSMQSLNIVSDIVGSSKTVDIRWSDDDYNTWSSWKTLSFSPRAYFCSLGSFRRRAFNIKYTGGIPARFEALEFDVRQWKA